MDLQQRLAGLAADGRAWVHVATIDSVEEHAAFGLLVNCTIRPDGRAVQARLLSPGGGAGRGAFFPVEQHDEVLLLLPEGDANRAVAIAGLSSRRNPLPSSADNGHLDIVEPGGVEVRRTEAAAVEQVVLASLLSGLATVLGELAAGVATGAPTPLTIESANFIANLPTTHRSQALKTE